MFPIFNFKISLFQLIFCFLLKGSSPRPSRPVLRAIQRGRGQPVGQIVQKPDPSSQARTSGKIEPGSGQAQSGCGTLAK